MYNEKLKRRKCEICGKLFRPSNRVQKYCSPKCYYETATRCTKQYSLANKSK